MKVGLTTSLTLHAVALGFGLVSLSSPRALEVGSVESFPVDIVPIEEVAQSVQGDRQAPAAERPAPTPTAREDVVEDAQQVGENTVDLTTPPTPDPRPRPVETAEAPPPAPTPPEPAREPVPEPEPQPQPEPEPVPATEVTPEPQPAQEVTPEPAPDTAVAEAPQADSLALPTAAPRPQSRPQPPQAQTAKTPERREPERPAEPQRTAAASSQEDNTRNIEDEVAALLNRERASGGGAQRSTEQAALGGRETTGARLSQSEMDALRGQIQRCWNVPAGAADAENLKVSVQFRLNQAGALDGTPQIIAGGGSGGIERAAAESARRAVLACAPYTLPADKYEAWSDVIVHFDPRDMF